MKAIGIDLGTTYSAVAVMEGGTPTIIANAEGLRTTPSVVATSQKGERLVGEIAKRQAVMNPDNTISSIKRDMGSSKKVNMAGKDYKPEEISAIILAKLKKDAEKYLGAPVSKAVITVPAYFNDAQRQATKDAGAIADLEVLRIINEPTAASLAYGLDKKSNETILVYDLGGGTFDVSILEVGEGLFEVKSTAGNNMLGGDDFDQVIIDYCVEEFKKDTGVDLKTDKMALQRLKDAAEKAKKDLSGIMQVQINLPFITADATGPKHLDVTLSRAKFEDLIKKYIDETVELTKRAIADAKLSGSDIDEIVMVGGSTRIPLVIESIKQLIGKDPHQGLNPDECVALGAAVQAGVLQGDVKDVLLLDVTPLSLGIETLGGVSTVIIERNTTIPAKKSQVFSTAADNQNTVDIHVLQGERKMASHNKTLGRFLLDGIPPAPRGVPQIEVTFDIDANGIVNVSALDKATNKKQNITISGGSGLDKDEIAKMMDDAKANEEEDAKFAEKVETKNMAETSVYAAEKLVKENEDKIDEDKKKALQEKIDKLKDAISKDDTEGMKSGLEDMNKTLHEISTSLYQGAQAAEQQQANQDAGSQQEEPKNNDEKVVDAEFKEE